MAQPLPVWSSQYPEGTDLEETLGLKELLRGVCHAGAPADAAMSLSCCADMDSEHFASSASLPLKLL